jgi:hypothetical protein
MPRRSPYEEDYEFDDDDENDPKRRVRHFKKGRDEETKKRWERESYYDSDNDYDERR